jgi:hypothetical protein
MEVLSMAEWFHINGPNVSREVFADEVIVVDFIGGAYYSLDPVATDIWREMEKGLSRYEIIAALCRDYLGEPIQIEADVNCLLDQLLGEKLIVPVSAAPVLPRHEARVTLSSPTPRPFRTPILTKFTDMQDLLLLDPIHDVDNTGWPARK